MVQSSGMIIGRSTAMVVSLEPTSTTCRIIICSTVASYTATCSTLPSPRDSFRQYDRGVPLLPLIQRHFADDGCILVPSRSQCLDDVRCGAGGDDCEEPSCGLSAGSNRGKPTTTPNRYKKVKKTEIREAKRTIGCFVLV